MKINELLEQKVSSSWLKDVTMTNNNAVMTLQNGDKYQILDLTPEEYEQWINSPSTGAFFTKNIKPTHTVNKL